MPFINGIGPGELIVILIIALIVVGPGKLPDVGAALGKSIREFRKAATDVKESVSLDAAPAPVAPAPAPVAPATQPQVVPPTPVQVAPPTPAATMPPVVPAAVAVVAETPVIGAPVAVEVVAPDPETAEWPAEIAPVDEHQPTASA